MGSPIEVASSILDALPESGEIDAYDAWQRFLQGKAESTRKIYTRYFQRFCKWMGVTPNQLYALKRQLEAANDPKRKYFIEDRLVLYVTGETKQDPWGQPTQERFSVSTQNNIYAAVQSFFKYHRCEFTLNVGVRRSSDAIGSDAPTAVQVRQILHAAKSQQYRVAILLLKDTGQRMSDLVKLRWDQVEYTDDYFVRFDRIITQKKRVIGVPFAGPDAYDALQILQKDRKGPRIFKVQTAKSLGGALNKFIKQSGVTGVTAHGLRKFFSHALIKAKVPDKYRLRMMGKRVSTYERIPPDILFDAYRQAYDQLRIFTDPDSANVTLLKQELDGTKDTLDTFREDVRLIREENQWLRREVTALRPLTAENKQLRRQVEQFGSDLARLKEGVEERFNLLYHLPQRVLYVDGENQESVELAPDRLNKVLLDDYELLKTFEPNFQDVKLDLYYQLLDEYERGVLNDKPELNTIIVMTKDKQVLDVRPSITFRRAKTYVFLERVDETSADTEAVDRAIETLRSASGGPIDVETVKLPREIKKKDA